MAFRKILWNKWILNYSLGELVGIGVAAALGRLLFISFPPTSSLSTSFMIVLILITAGALEGIVLGYIQWKSLS
ncbi:MAG TPA: hypothetical protein VFU05_19575, partial [Cyclobacteriaceae bacterium]|nr:hypothetical protein [Cyclobacteriaceae bacterium]